jgi:hypothetical protein
MTETVLGFFLGLLMAWPVWILFFVIAVLSENFEGFKTTVFFNTLLVVGLFLGFQISGASWWQWYYIFGYPAVGLLYSGIRWRVWCSSIATKLEMRLERNNFRSNTVDGYVEEAEHEMDPRVQYKRITTWILAWPTSILYWSCSDMIMSFAQFVRRKMAVIYIGLGSSARGRVQRAREKSK